MGSETYNNSRVSVGPNTKAGAIGLTDFEVPSASEFRDSSQGNLGSSENIHLFKRKADINYYQLQEQN